MNVALIGGGSSAHLLAALLGNRNHRVKILTTRPSEWLNEITLHVGHDMIHGEIDGASSDPLNVVSEAQVVILCMPVHQYPVALLRIIPSLMNNPNCIVGAVYGQAGFDWMIRSAAQKFRVRVPRHFAIGLLPWIVRTLKYGESAISYGPKCRNGIATSDESTFDFLASNLLPDFSYNYWGTGTFERVPNFLTITLTVDNQIIHPSRCFALATQGASWEDTESVPYFYRDWDDYSAGILRGVDLDYTHVRSALFKRFPLLSNKYDLDYLGLEQWSYGSHNPDIKASFVNSTTLAHIKPPTVINNEGLHVLDFNHRFFKDDFAFGLEVCQWFADELTVEVPHIRRLIDWYHLIVQPQQTTMISPGIPPKYGLSLDQVTFVN